MKYNMFKVLPKSLWVMTFNSGSCNGCDIEITATLAPRYDIERFGVKLVSTPRHADVLIVTGPVTKYMRHKLLRIYNQMPDPKLVLVVGNCGCSGDVCPVDNVIPVDAYVHGCPPHPEAVIEGIAKAANVIEAERL